MEGGVILISSRGDDYFVEDGVGEDVDEEDLSLSDRKAKEVDGDFVGRSVQDRGHSAMGRVMLEERLISLPAGVIWAVLGLLPHVLPIRSRIL